MVNELAEDVLAINPSIAVTLRVGDHVPCPSRRKNNDLPGLVRKVPPLRSADILGLHLEEMSRNMPHACRYFHQGGSHRCIGSSNNLNVFLFLTMCENSNLCLEIAALSRVR